ncbi:KAT8 regulatory NSL complex subunit 1-like [Acanthaster planci]|uniref:KAT8 regulatory NSL complex subunit 1-like n=1 Tax=Acanthaster planci TaxID=133434 RepID=A0A8B7Y5F7_ACAPL|nr:KAT8 regulatory NSL complex subunit 1-like [Acanthaster planci]
MAAMAPALTDASAHPSGFKLPISPSDPERTGFEATPSDPTSPGLPNGHTSSTHSVDTSQTIQETGLDKSLLLQEGLADQSGSNNHRSKIQLFRTNSQPQGGGSQSGTGVTFLGKVDRGKVSRSLTFPSSTRTSVLTNGSDGTVKGITKMSRSTVSGAYDKQQPCQTIAPTASTITMPPQTSSLSLANNTDVTASSSTATADSSDADDDMRGGQVDLQPADETDSGPHQDLSTRFEKLVSKVSRKQNMEDWMRDSRSSDLAPELLEAEQINKITDERSKLAQRARQLVHKLRHLQAQQISSYSKQQIHNFVQEQHKRSEEKTTELEEGCPDCKRNLALSNVPNSDVPSISQKGSSANSTFAEDSKEQLPRTCVHKRKPLPVRPSGIDPSVRVAVKTATKHLQAQLEHVEGWVDSDETESSSGGESCDEGDDTLPSYTQTRQKHKVPLHRRAVWKWAVERAAIASRWTWLQAQVSDLEYRIRQQSDIYRQTRASKGVAILGEPSSPEDLLKMRVMTSTKTNRKLSPIEAKIARLGSSQEMSPSNLSTLLTNVDQQSARLKMSLQNCVSPMSGLVIPPSAASTPTGANGKTPLSKPMNGVVSSTGSHGNPLLGSSTSSPVGDHKQLPQGINSFHSSPSLMPAVPEEHYCARTRPVWYFRKRKLIRTLNIHSFSRKIQKLSTVRCGCCPPLTPCVMCGGRFNHVEKPKEPDMAPLNERVAQLDFSFHPVLSFTQDIPLSIQFEGMMKSNEWQRKPALSKQSPMKKKRRPSTPPENKDGQRPKRKYERKNKDKTKRHQSSGEDKSLKMLRKLAAQTMKDMRHGRGDKILKRANSKASSLPNTPKKRLTEEINRRCRTDIKKRRAAQLAIAALKKTRARSLSLPNIKDHLQISSLSSSPSTPTAPDGSLSSAQLSHSMPSASLQNFLKPRRPGGSSDQYDIDNIVIPYSMLASTRVEKLEYKEIMTPKWRKIPEEQLTAWKNHVQEFSNQEDIENLSDSEFTERHAKCEINERQKFLTILASQNSHANQRRGARRSRNNSQGNTPEPYSPDANLFEQNQPSSVNSSNAPSPLTTQEALSPSGGVPASSNSGGSSTQRSRMNSWEKRRSSSASDTNLESSLAGSFEALGHIDNPWPERNFPLDEDDCEELGLKSKREAEEETEMKSGPEAEEKTPSEVSSATNLLNNMKTEGESLRSSPLGEMLDDSSSEPEEIDDPNDPEWTVVSPDRHRSSIVLRLAKR